MFLIQKYIMQKKYLQQKQLKVELIDFRVTGKSVGQKRGPHVLQYLNWYPQR